MTAIQNKIHITQAELAALCNCSPQHINKLIKSGSPGFDVETVGKSKSGKPKYRINNTSASTIEFIKAHQSKKEPTPKKKTTPDHPGESPTKKKSKNKPATTEHATAVKFGTVEKHILDKEKTIEQIEKLRIDNWDNRMELIPRIMVKKLLSQLYTIDENQLKPIGHVIGPKISVIYNDSNQQKTLEIIELLGVDKKKFAPEINKILHSGEPDRIQSMTSIIEDEMIISLKAIKQKIDMFIRGLHPTTEVN